MAPAIGMGPAARMLDATRLHLQHGPIDLIIEAWGPDRLQALRQAEARFQTVLTGLVAELAGLRLPLRNPIRAAQGRAEQVPFLDPTARRMAAAVAPFETFITPMAAVAGSVADEVLAAMTAGTRLDKAYVNNGGDIAFYLGEGASLTAAIHDGRDAGRVRLDRDQPARGLATSGWRGRSHSLGIANAVTVVARSAAMADAAATLIANAVDLPGHAAISREPARALAPDSDLGERQVTVGVGALRPAEIAAALDAGCRVATGFRRRGLIDAAALFLGGQTALVGQMNRIGESQDARLHIA